MTDERVLAEAWHRAFHGHKDGTCSTDRQMSDPLLAALDAAGYVIVPKDGLERARRIEDAARSVIDAGESDPDGPFYYPDLVTALSDGGES